MKAQTRQMKRTKGPKTPKSPEIPVNTTPSNKKGDQLALMGSYGLIVVAVGTIGMGLYFAILNGIQACSKNPVDLTTLLSMILLATVSVLVARSIFWLSFFGPVMLGSRMGAWQSSEQLCRNAIKLPAFLSRGTSWASVSLVQSLVNRGEYSDAMQAAEEEWQRTGEDVRQAQNLGPLCVATGIASQVQEDLKESLKWNERAIQCLNNAVEELSKPKTGLMAKALSPQSGEWLGQVRTQLSIAHFNIATIYFQKMDYRRAKENFKKAVEVASQAPDFPQKSDILKISKDQLARLKHA